jgi:hypothetical protein
VALAVYALAFAIMPSARDRLVTEDGIIETTTAMAFLGAAILGLYAVVTSGARRLYWLIPAFGLFGFLDEMSFGARLFGFPLPVIDGLEIDSFHDIFDLADRAAGDLGVSRTQIAAVLVVAAVAVAVYLVRSGRMRVIPSWLTRHRPILLSAMALGLLLVAIGLDLIGSSTVARFAEETAEFAAAGLVAVAAADIARSDTEQRPRVPAATAGRSR